MNNTIYQYQTKSIQSNSSPCKKLELQQIVEKIRDGYLICWMHHTLIILAIEKAQLIKACSTFEHDIHEFGLRIRAFNDNAEYHYWKSSNVWTGRYREDNIEGTNVTEVIDTYPVLRGSIAKLVSNVYHVAGQDELFKIGCRNYLDHHTETYQAFYSDCRFFKIV